ncbi:MAG: AAC(3) family N-acetyltransferase [Firmicutes bacterium]|nr:AAC(3) family N-acetyltransferase [Bacillota bacterium]
MYTKEQLINHISQLGIKSQDTLLIHSSMKAIGPVEGGADTVLDAFIDYMQDGLLVFPTHTWKQINSEYNVFDVANEPSCVGILTELFRKRPGVIRSWHPTHSVAALGKDAEQYVAGEEKWDTPCPRQGCWGKLYDRRAKILFIGCDLTRNTIIHGVEEWNNIPNRLTAEPRPLKILTPAGTLLDRPLYRHYNPITDVSSNYGKLEAPLVSKGIARIGRFGDARTILCDVVPMVDLTSSFLRRNPDLFLDDRPIPEEWYR